MKGHVDAAGRALVTIHVHSTDSDKARELPVWIDTGFNGELVLPQEMIHSLNLQSSGTLKAILADGSQVSLERYTCKIDWFDTVRELEVVANEGEYPLLGVGLLLGHDLLISYRDSSITIQ